MKPAATTEGGSARRARIGCRRAEGLRRPPCVSSPRTGDRPSGPVEFAGSRMAASWGVPGLCQAVSFREKGGGGVRAVAELHEQAGCGGQVERARLVFGADLAGIAVGANLIE
jgi:hypothetical protein